MQVDMEKLARLHLKMRDRKAEINRKAKEEVARIDEQMDKLNAFMLNILRESKLKSMTTEAGTIYKEDDIIPRAENWNDVFDFVRENDGFDIFERRLKKTFVQEYMDAHEGQPPPGVGVMREVKVHVRRK